MRTHRWITLTACFGLLLNSAVLAFAQKETTGNVNHPARTQQFDLRRFEELTALSPVERARRGIAFLREEVTTPSPSREGYVGVIDHDSILATMASLLVEHEPDLGTIKAEHLRMPAGELKDVVTVVVGLMGERAILPQVATFFANSANPPRLRVLASKVMQEMPDARLIPYAVNVLTQDTSAQIRAKHNRQTNGIDAYVRRYFVREAALNVLKALDKGGISVGQDVRRLMDSAVIEAVVSPQEALRSRQ